MFLIYCTEILRGMGDQRLTDLGTLKHIGLTYLMADHEPHEPPISNKAEKSKRGFNHPQIAQIGFSCARSLCHSMKTQPRKYQLFH